MYSVDLPKIKESVIKKKSQRPTAHVLFHPPHIYPLIHLWHPTIDETIGIYEYVDKISIFIDILMIWFYEYIIVYRWKFWHEILVK